MTRRNNSGDGLAGLRSRAALSAAAGLALAGLAGGIASCAGNDASGATVRVYVAAPLCGGAKGELAAHGGAAGNFDVAIRCLAASEPRGGGVDLAVAGSNSRRATEDTGAIATLEPPGAAVRFTRPILESAGIPLLTARSGGAGMRRILSAVESAGRSDVRASVREALAPA